MAMEAVVGAVVGTIVQPVLHLLISLPMEKFNQIRDFSDDVEKLRSHLSMITATLHEAEMQQITNSVVKQWAKKLEDASYEAYNALDEFDYHLLRQKRNEIDGHNSAMRKLKSIFSGSYSKDPRLILGRKIKHVNQKLESINREASDMGIHQMILRGVTVNAPPGVVGYNSDSSATLETDSYTLDPVFLGRDDDVMKIVEKLINDGQTEQVLSIIPIVGMGGLGKSTLAQKVYHHEKIQARFGTRIWVHVSPKFDPFTLFKKILEALTSEKVEVENREVLLRNLGHALAAKTFLLVLDDVWNQDRQKWEWFINSLSGVTSTKGNCVVVTTRNREVALIVETLPTYELESLPEDSCWSIIKAKAFGGIDVIPPKFETIGRNIAKRCRGLPLAANIVGGVLRGKSEDEWLSIQENWLSDHVEGDVIAKILKLSFDNLPSPSLKKCFAYCSIFPKGDLIEREKLIELWMAEGFLQHDLLGSDMETVGDRFFNLLVQRSLLQAVHGYTYYYIMHDLVHDVACSVLGTRYIGDASRPIPKDVAKDVRTLFYKGRVQDAMFPYMKSLHALTLEDDEIEVLPSSIGELMHLRCLNIFGCHIKCLPDAIGELYNLQTLRVFSMCLSKLPSTLKYLISLRHLYIPNCTELPGDMGMLTSLRTIAYFKVGDKKGHRIVELGCLKKLQGKLEIRGLEKVKNREEAKSACIFRKTNIVELVLRWSESKEGVTFHENVLEGLQPHSYLERLEIDGFKGSRFPLWTLKMAIQDGFHWKGFNKLREIRLESCFECEEIPCMGQLPHLRSLFLSNLKNVKSIGSSFYGTENCSSNKVFPALERFELKNLPKLRDWQEVGLQSAECQVEIFPCLEYLDIKYCRELRSAPTQFPCLKELRIEEMNSGSPLADICRIKCRPSLAKLTIKGLDEMEYLTDGLFYNNPRLTKLLISSCPKLRQLPDGLHILSSLEKLSIHECPSLQCIPCSSTESSTSLRKLSIQDCSELMNVPCEMVESCATLLECLELRGIRKVTNMQMIIDSLHKMPRLTELDIRGVPKFGKYKETPSLGSLRELTIGVGYPWRRDLDCFTSDDSWDGVSFNEGVDGMLEASCHESLQHLRLVVKEDWELPLPTRIQHLTCLSTLALDGFGIQELPEWLGGLSSLQLLCVCDCKKLVSLEAIRGLTNLTTLYVESCPLLEDDAVPEWFKEVGTGLYISRHTASVV